MKPGDVFGVIVVVCLLILYMGWQASESKRCNAKGGTYLYRELKCIAVRTIP